MTNAYTKHIQELLGHRYSIAHTGLSDNDTDAMAYIKQIVDGIRSGSSIFAECDSETPSTTSVFSSGMIGYGDDYFNNGFYMVVVYTDDGAAPVGEIRDITDYDSATGEFTCSAFSANVETGDGLAVLHESEAVALFLYLKADGTGVYPASVGNDSALAKLMSKADPAAASSYSNTTDSLEMLSDKIGAFSGDGGAAQDDSAKASLDLAHTDLDSIISKVDVIDGYHDVPTADATTNAVIRDVVGNKADAAVTTVAATKSLTAYSKGILNTVRYGDGIWFDSVNGTAGTTHPTGTAGQPCSSEADVVTLLASIGLSKVYIVNGTFAVPSAMNNVAFVGITLRASTNSINLNGEDVDGCNFTSLSVRGTNGGTGFIYLWECYVDEALQSTGIFAFRSSIGFVTVTLGDGYLYLMQCGAATNLGCTLALGTPLTAVISDWYGTVSIASLTGGTALLECSNSTSVTIDNSCTGGDLYLSGVVGALTDNSAGTTVHDETISSAIAVVKAILDTSGVLINSKTQAFGRLKGETQTKEVSVTSAANAGSVTLATVTTQPCFIKSVTLHADTASQTDLTSAAITGAGGVITFISAADAAVANIDAADEQVAWVGRVRLAATKTIVIDLQGTGATAVDLTVTIEYEACVDGGYLA